MEDQQDISALCLQEFTRASASVSHELKNTLAIINESAGLLEDFVAMAGPDGLVPSEHIQAATSSIMKQVSRSNLILTHLNSFAHSGDTPISLTEIKSFLDMIVALSERQAKLKNINVTVGSMSSFPIKTALLPLGALLFHTLQRLFTALPNSATVSISWEISEKTCTIKLATDNNTADTLTNFPDISEEALASHFEGSCKLERNYLKISFHSH